MPEFTDLEINQIIPAFKRAMTGATEADRIIMTDAKHHRPDRYPALLGISRYLLDQERKTITWEPD